MDNIQGKKKKVCIIDDSENIREMYSLKFTLEGFEVISAENGEEGLKLIREQKPDIVLLDVVMPIKSGTDVLAEKEKDEALKSIPVIVLSNISDERTFSKVGKFNTYFYVVKALVTPQKVVDLVRDVLHC